jgi:hypothetical protein
MERLIFSRMLAFGDAPGYHKRKQGGITIPSAQLPSD